MGFGTWGQEVVLRVSVDPHSPRPHRVRQDVHHRERSTHEAEAEARHWDKTSTEECFIPLPHFTPESDGYSDITSISSRFYSITDISILRCCPTSNKKFQYRIYKYEFKIIQKQQTSRRDILSTRGRRDVYFLTVNCFTWYICWSQFFNNQI